MPHTYYRPIGADVNPRDKLEETGKESQVKVEVPNLVENNSNTNSNESDDEHDDL